MAIQIRRYTALLTAGAILASVFAASTPVTFGRIKASESVISFANKLSDLRQPVHEQFASLTIPADRAEIYRDGNAVGNSFAGFSIRNGELKLRKSETLTDAEKKSYAESEKEYVSLDEAAAKIGCEIHEENGLITIESPFQNAELIVEANADFPHYGAIQQTEGYENLHVLQYKNAADAYAAYKKMLEDPAVLSVEPNRTFYIAEDMEPRDPRLIQVDDRWGLDAIGVDPYLEWLMSEKEELPEIVVAVIDTGIYADHKWFEGRIAAGGTGFTRSEKGSVVDKQGHGTHCAGIICSASADNVKILPLKSLDDSGYGDSLEVYCAMAYAAEMNVDAVSMSLGGFGISPLLSKAAEMLAQKGIPLAVAAGNESVDVMYSHPANVASVLTVSAVCQEQNDSDIPVYQISDYSNYGNGVDFSAPGSNIYSAGIDYPSQTTLKSGTSMATPYVAACVADLLSYDKSMSNDQIYNYLRLSAIDLGSAGFDELFGWGMVNLADVRPNQNFIPSPHVSEPSGTYKNVISVRISSEDANSQIYYTLDGSVPTAENGILYRAGEDIQINESCTLKAIVVTDDGISCIAERRYMIVCSQPVFDRASGSYSNGFTVKITSDTEGAVIRYTTDGSVPSLTNGILYNSDSGVEISSSALLQAVAIIGNTVSAVTRAEYMIKDEDVEDAFLIQNGVLVRYSGVSKCISLKDTDMEITEVGDHAFSGSTQIYDVYLPETVTKIGASAFEGCDNLCEVVGYGVKELGESAFRDCTQLQEVSFSDELTEIPSYAFYNCFSLYNNDSNFSSVTVIGDYAFKSCTCLGYKSDQFDWRKVLYIGDNAFDHAAIHGTLSLESIQYLGKYAFADIEGCCSIHLSSNITALQEGTFQNTLSSFNLLDLPGVTEIGDYALSIFYDTYEGIYLDYSKITKIGSHGMANLTLPDNVEFTALSEIGEYAFFNCNTSSLSFPALKSVSTNCLRDINVSTIFLEKAETIETNAISVCQNDFVVVFGDHLMSIADNGIINPYYMSDWHIAGPAGSPAAQFASERAIDFIETPAVIIDAQLNQNGEYICQCQQYVPTIIHSYALGFGLNVTWSNEGNSNRVDYTEDGFLHVNTAEVGDFLFYAHAVQDGNIVADSKPLHIHVSPTIVAAELTEKNTFTLIDWTTVTDDPESNDMDSPCLSFRLDITEDGDYTVIPADSSMHLQIVKDTGDSFDGYTPFSAKKGEVYMIIATQNEKSGSGFEQYTSLLNGFYIRNANDGWFSMYDVDIRGEFDSVQYEQTGTPRPDVELIALDYSGNNTDGDTLNPDTDYQLFSLFTDQLGTAYIFAFGSGIYCGMLVFEYRIYGNITEDHAIVAENVFQSHEVYYRFIPTEDDIYSFFTNTSSEEFQRKYSEYSQWGFSPMTVSLYDENWNLYAYDNGSEYMDLTIVSQFLNADETYYIGISCWNDRIQHAKSAEIVATRKTNIATLNPYPMDYILSYTGDPLEPKAQIWDGNLLLTEGTDYTLSYFNNIKPGFIGCVITGIGRYCGTACMYQTEIVIDTHDPNIISFEVGKQFELPRQLSLLSITIKNAGTYTLHSDNTEHYNCTVYSTSASLEWSEWNTVGCYTPEETDLYLYSGTFYFLFENEDYDAEPFASFILSTDSIQTSLENAYAEVRNVVYTGEPVTPDVTVWLYDAELTEGVDYRIEYLTDRIDCGLHTLDIIGLGEYCGVLTVQFVIVPMTKEITNMIQTGENVISITTPGDTMFFRWTPLISDSYCIASDLPAFRSISVFDEGMNPIVDGLSGIDLIYTEFSAQADTSYLISVSFTDPNKTGDIPLLITNDFCPFYDCEIEFDELVKFSAPTNLPEYQVYFDHTLLQEGVDYEVDYIGAEHTYGRAIIGLKGKGRYIGKQSIIFYIYPSSHFAINEQTELFLNDPAAGWGGMPGSIQEYTFTAPDDGTYYLNIPTYYSNGVNTFVYLNDAVQPMNVRCYSLSEGDVLSFVCITDWLEDTYSEESEFNIGISDSMEQSGYYYDADENVSYEILNNLATVTWIDPQSVGIFIHDAVINEQLISGRFSGFSEEIISELWRNHVIYGELNGAVHNYCIEHGLPFAAMDSTSDLTGDVNGDHMIFSDDAFALMYILGECQGMRIPDYALANADMNSDGEINLLDVREIQRYVSEHAVG